MGLYFNNSLLCFRKSITNYVLVIRAAHKISIEQSSRKTHHNCHHVESIRISPSSSISYAIIYFTTSQSSNWYHLLWYSGVL